jgi:hypothetical protein
LSAWLSDKFHALRGHRPPDDEDPAAMVGTYKLNKN